MQTEKKSLFENFTITIVVVLGVVFGYYFALSYFFPPPMLGPIFGRDEVCVTDMAHLSCIIHAEADTKDTEDMFLVGSTVLNRIEHGSFPATVDSVISQNGQYDGYLSKRFYRTEITDSVATELLSGRNRNCKVIFFYNKETATDKGFISWVERNYRLIAFSNSHMFYGK